ncbi:MAG: ATPase, T2SS/T4P/T4SS family [Candidatus Omnitrophota bacterium]
MLKKSKKNSVEEIHKLSNLNVRPVFSAISKIKDRIEKEYAGQPAAPQKLVPKDAAYNPPFAAPGYKKEVEELIEVASLTPVIHIVDSMIAEAVEQGASDIHLEPEHSQFRRRYRVDGILRHCADLPKKYEAAIISRIKIMSGMDIAEKRLPQDGRIQMKIENKKVDLRVSTFPTLKGENLVIRILDRTRALLELDQLGFSRETLGVFEKAVYRPYGIVLVTGPTGSGKTTTLYGALNKINNLEKNIMTLEDPVEYEIAGVRQSQINPKAGLTFANGLRSILRQDPDIIMVGEIRDLETAEISIQAALTGHLVLSTLHTNDAAGAIARLLDMGVEPFLVASSIMGVLAQRLVRKICENCKERYIPPDNILKDMSLSKETNLFEGKGCNRCLNTGYKGRIGIFEFMTPSDEIKELICKKASAVLISEAALRAGMKTLRDDGILKVKEGLTSVTEVLRVTKEA